MKLLSLDVFYVVAGVVLLLVAGHIAFDRGHPKRWGSVTPGKCSENQSRTRG